MTVNREHARQALTALVRGSEEPAGQYTYLALTGEWHWSDEVYRIYGFQPGEVVPSTDLMLTHRHPDDLDGLVDRVERLIADGGVFASCHRVVDARRRPRLLLATGAVAEHGGAPAVRGQLVDLTDVRHRESREQVQQAVEGVTEHRAAIEQVKGMLMLLHGIDPDTAFRMLAEQSQTTNVKVHVLAEQMRRDLVGTTAGAFAGRFERPANGRNGINGRG